MISRLSSTDVFMSSQHFFSTLWFVFGTSLVFMAAGYACTSLAAALISRRRRNAAAPAHDLQAVTVLKPLHGTDPRLYENLQSFCRQNHPQWQLVFGVRDPQDPAIVVVRQLQQAFPERTIDLVVDQRVYGANLKVSNLLNMLPRARHDWLVLADADISVDPDYLARVTAPLASPEVGIVTCLYHGCPQPGFWSRLGSLFVDDWFAPSVRLSHTFGSTRFAFGSTIALRRDSLQRIGGFERLSDALADDFWLGELTRQQGLRTVLSDVVVGTEISETRPGELWQHELRWLRTIRSIAPAGFVMSFVCFTWPVCLLGLWLAPTLWSGGLALLALAARMARFIADCPARRPASDWRDLCLTPLRDALLLLEWAVALTSWQVSWRGQTLHARRDGPARQP